MISLRSPQWAVNFSRYSSEMVSDCSVVFNPLTSFTDNLWKRGNANCALNVRNEVYQKSWLDARKWLFRMVFKYISQQNAPGIYQYKTLKHPLWPDFKRQCRLSAAIVRAAPTHLPLFASSAVRNLNFRSARFPNCPPYGLLQSESGIWACSLNMDSLSARAFLAFNVRVINCS